MKQYHSAFYKSNADLLFPFRQRFLHPRVIFSDGFQILFGINGRLCQFIKQYCLTFHQFVAFDRFVPTIEFEIYFAQNIYRIYLAQNNGNISFGILPDLVKGKIEKIFKPLLFDDQAQFAVFVNI